jgi:hypothetical protein
LNRSTLLAIILVSLVVVIISASGCGGAGLLGGPDIGSTTGTVTDNPRSIVPWKQIEGQTNVAATMRVNDKGTTVTEIPAEIFSAKVRSVNLSGRQEPNVEDLECQPGNNRGVFEGDSGSPVLIEGKVAGGLYGSADAISFGARGIEQEIATASGPAKMRSARMRAPRFFEGPEQIYLRLKQAPGFGGMRYNGPHSLHNSLVSGSSVPPLPGRRYASPFVIGPYVVGYDAATYTYQLPSGAWVATAHGLEDAGNVRWPVTSFFVDGFANGAVKGHITGGVYGTITYDGLNGSLINASIPAPMMAVTENITFNAIPKPSVTHEVRYDLGSDTERQGVGVAAQVPLEVQLRGQSGLNATGTAAITAGTTSVHQLNFPANMSLATFENDLAAQLDTLIQAEYRSDPTHQITRVTVTLKVTG